MAQWKTVVTPLLMHQWSYCSLALSHWYQYTINYLLQNRPLFPDLPLGTRSKCGWQWYWDMMSQTLSIIIRVVNSRTLGWLEAKNCLGCWITVAHGGRVYYFHRPCVDLTHIPLDKMASISQTSSSDAFSWMKSFRYCLKFQWCRFLTVKLKINQHW